MNRSVVTIVGYPAEPNEGIKAGFKKNDLKWFARNAERKLPFLSSQEELGPFIVTTVIADNKKLKGKTLDSHLLVPHVKMRTTIGRMFGAL